MLKYRYIPFLVAVILPLAHTQSFAEERRTASASHALETRSQGNASARVLEMDPSKWRGLADALSTHLRSSHSEVRTQAAAIAAQHGEKGTELLLSHLQSPDSSYATDIIPHLMPRTRAQQETMFGLLRTNDIELREGMIEHLAIQDFETLEVLVQATERGVLDHVLVAEVLRRSTQWGYSWIDEALREENPTLSNWLTLVGALNNPVFMGRLDSLYARGHEGLQRQVIRSWARMDPQWVCTRLLNALDDSRASVQNEALRGLRCDASPETSTRLMQHMTEKGIHNGALITALGRTRTREAVGAFEKAWPTASLGNRLAMLDAAANISTRESLAFLFEGTIAHEPILRERAAELLHTTQ